MRMIKKVSRIQNLGLYSDFSWNQWVRDLSGNIVEFQKLNILYGRNYSGKTTLSRAIRAMETGVLPPNYETASFEIETDSGTVRSSNLVSTSPVRVYNRDFVRDNLKFIVDDTQDIESFAILGEDKVKIEEKLEANKTKLGSVESSSGLLFQEAKAEDEAGKAAKRTSDKRAELEALLGNKANQSIKRNPLYGVVTYNITNLKSDITTVGEYQKYSRLSNEDLSSLTNLVRETIKEPIGTFSFPISTASLGQLIDRTRDLVCLVIQPTKSIERLLSNPKLQEWVREGLEIHQEQHTQCEFCGNPISGETWIQLGEHFNQASKQLRSDLATLKSDLLTRKRDVLSVNRSLESMLYADSVSTFREIERKVDEIESTRIAAIVHLESLISTREENIYTPVSFPDIADSLSVATELSNELLELIRTNDNRSQTLARDQQLARQKLRLDDVAGFLVQIEYQGLLSKISDLEAMSKETASALFTVKIEVESVRAENSRLILELKDEEKGAAKVGEYLNHYFGHAGILLVPIERTDRPGFVFRVLRGDQPARNLSEGECSILSFCYFMARLDDTNTKGLKPIIWIDDPISSLDNNHIFYVFSLIEKVITKPQKLADGRNDYNYDQLFISTHNLDFLKYLKQLSIPKKSDRKDVEYFLIDRTDTASKIVLMPSYLRKYTTEFNYLFDQIVKCSKVDQTETNYEVFYNFSNNLRKFLEAYLFYKYPSNTSIIVKMGRFFRDDDASTALTNRVQNELSHLEEIFDRSLSADRHS